MTDIEDLVANSQKVYDTLRTRISRSKEKSNTDQLKVVSYKQEVKEKLALKEEERETILHKYEEMRDICVATTNPAQKRYLLKHIHLFLDEMKEKYGTLDFLIGKEEIAKPNVEKTETERSFEELFENEYYKISKKYTSMSEKEISRIAYENARTKFFNQNKRV